MWTRALLLGTLVLTLVMSPVPGSHPAQAQASPQQELLNRATLALSAVRQDDRLGQAMVSALNNAKGVIIVPNLIKGGFIIGGEGGTGVMLARLADGSWSAPAFIAMGAASIGLQIGGSISEVVFTIMTQDGLDAVLVNKVKLGADAGLALGPIGANVEAATTTAGGADIYSYAVSQGLFGGGAFEGAVITQRHAWNKAFYGADYLPRRILTDPSITSPGADILRANLGGG
ncbi:MAG: lipid-binding SYLF domain-containing protein [Alphaproteobacteria bacterium]